MELKQILNPKGWFIAIGVLILLVWAPDVLDGEGRAVGSWGEDNLGSHDVAYEEMWAMWVLPLALMAISTGFFVKGKPLSQMAMAASATILLLLGGMIYMNGRHGYGEGAPIFVPITAATLVILLGISGYLHRNDE